jgi:hypothetical protein
MATMLDEKGLYVQCTGGKSPYNHRWELLAIIDGKKPGYVEIHYECKQCGQRKVNEAYWKDERR